MASKEGWGDLRQLILPFYNKGKEKTVISLHVFFTY